MAVGKRVGRVLLVQQDRLQRHAPAIPKRRRCAVACGIAWRHRLAACGIARRRAVACGGTLTTVLEPRNSLIRLPRREPMKTPGSPHNQSLYGIAPM